jgi:pyruvate kinase
MEHAEMSIVTQLELLKKRRTKIIATIGPATAGTDGIRDLLAAGANIFRLNMSHGDHATHRQVFDHIRHIAAELKEPIAVFADLCGPKIRTGRFRDNSIELVAGEEVTVTTRGVIGEPGLIPSQYASLADDVKPGDRILLADGLMELLIDRIDDTEIHCHVIHGGQLGNNKGMNLPGVDISAPALTDKDRNDAHFALELGVDYLALSFVRRREDIDDLRALIETAGHDTPIIAKIEKREALDDMTGILQATDAIMIARGDLGVELSPEQVPIAQKQLIEMARRYFKPVIVATQMLESMIQTTRPTRAEVTDVSNAVSLGADAVMLSGETAIGAYPTETVRMMDRVVRNTETFIWREGGFLPLKRPTERRIWPIWEAMANATYSLADDLQVRSICVISQSGMSVATISAVRPPAPILAITGREQVSRRLALMWGVIPVLSENAGHEKPNVVAREISSRLELAGSGDYILLVRGFHSDPMLNTPSVTTLMV